MSKTDWKSEFLWINGKIPLNLLYNAFYCYDIDFGSDIISLEEQLYTFYMFYSALMNKNCEMWVCNLWNIVYDKNIDEALYDYSGYFMLIWGV